MFKNKEIFYLGVLLALALVIGLGFWAYYSTVDIGNKSEEKRDEVKEESKAEDYSDKIKVTFTDEVHSRSQYQTIPRLKTYVGKVQNSGDKTVTYTSIKVYYLDNSGKGIWEETISISDTLKPNYIKEFPFGGMDVSSEWAGKVTYELTALQFENQPRITIPYRSNSPLQPPFQNLLFPIF